MVFSIRADAALLGATLFAVACASGAGGKRNRKEPDTTATSAAPATAEAVPRCSTDLRSALRDLGAPGASAGIVKDGRLVCTTTAGYANINADRRVTEDTVFAWASVSKTVTATALMILHDDDYFELDDPISRYLPFPLQIPDCPGESPTFRHLLTHTSSIKDNDSVYFDTYTRGDATEDLGTFLREYLVEGGRYYHPNRNFANGCPQSAYHYSNVGAGLIGHLVEVISGEPFDEFCAEHIFAPLGMDETSWRLADLDPANVAMPYGRRGGSYEALGHTGFTTYPDGLLRSSVPQLARFLNMFIEHGEVDGVRILERSTAARMRQVSFPYLDDTQGLIWYYDSYRGRRGVLGHDGSDPGTASLMFFDPDDGAGALIVANGDWYDVSGGVRAADALIEALFDEAHAY